MVFQKMPITVLSARPKCSGVFREGARYAADEEFMCSARLGWPI